MTQNMNYSIFEMTVPVFMLHLRNLDKFFNKAQEHAQKKNFNVDTLFTARLAPDQFPLSRQVQIVCDAAKMNCARLTGKVPPKFEDNETTLGQFRERIAKTLAYLETVKPDDFSHFREQKIEFAWNPGVYMNGGDYILNYGLPNFFFHMTTAYSILRHNGVDLGKADYLGSIPYKQK